MAPGPVPSLPPGRDLLAIVPDALRLAGVQNALRRIGAPPARPVAVEEALARLVGPGQPPLGILADPPSGEAAGHPAWHALREAAEDLFAPTRLLLLGPGPEDPAALLAALRRLTRRPEAGEAGQVAALRRGLDEGEVVLRYQPLVRLADGAPVALEGLVRWLRPDGAGGPVPVPPDDFIPMAERGGLAMPLSRTIGRIAAGEIRALPPGIALPVSINLPLEVLLRRDTAPWLARLCREERLRPERLGIELTETTPARDLPALMTAVLRLRLAGHPVAIDDMSLEERRDALFHLPFTGIKLDRHLLGAAPASHRARHEIRRLIALAHGRGMTVTAEGITGPDLWHLARRAGADFGQGFAIGRPLPASALPAWRMAWLARGTARVGYLAGM